MDIRVYDMLHTNSRGVTSLIDLSESTWTFFQQVLVGCFQSYEIPPHRIFEYSAVFRIFKYSVPSLQNNDFVFKVSLPQKKKKEIQVSNPGPSWPSCLL